MICSNHEFVYPLPKGTNVRVCLDCGQWYWKTESISEWTKTNKDVVIHYLFYMEIVHAKSDIDVSPLSAMFDKIIREALGNV